jgi:hypothetical protein
MVREAATLNLDSEIGREFLPYLFQTGRLFRLNHAQKSKRKGARVCIVVASAGAQRCALQHLGVRSVGKLKDLGDF